jgi:hypothetical protein
VILQADSANNAGLVRTRVVKNRRGYWRIRHFQPTDLHAVADLQVCFAVTQLFIFIAKSDRLHLWAVLLQRVHATVPAGCLKGSTEHLKVQRTSAVAG